MKKVLLSMSAALLLGSGVFAQDLANFVTENATTQVEALVGLIPANDFDTDPARGNLNQGWSGCYTITWDGANNDVMKVTFAKKDHPNYDDFALTFSEWLASADPVSDYKFTKNLSGEDTAHAKAVNLSVDFTEEANRDVSFKVQADNKIWLRVNIGDVNGRSVNYPTACGFEVAATTGGVDIADAAKWTSVRCNWAADATATSAVDGATDTYSPKWHGVGNPFNGTATDLDLSAITKISFAITDDKDDYEIDNAVLYIRDIKIGASATTTTYAPYVNLETVSGAALEVVDGVIYSAGAITVTNVAGQVVKVADKTLEISSLPAGVLVITAAEGTAKIVK